MWRCGKELTALTKSERIEAAYQYGRNKATELQTKAPDMTGTELYAEDMFIPSFLSACAVKNMIDRKAGFVCKSSAGRVVRLIQPYDSSVYTGEPEDLAAQWGFVWSDDPSKALPFIALSTSPYNTGNCCLENGVVYRSKIANNVWSPSAYPNGWEEVPV